MSRITRDTGIDIVKEDGEKWRFLAQWLENLVQLLNNGLKFSDNFDAKIVSAVFTAANTDTAVTHGLGRVPSGYIITSSSASMSVYTGSIAWTSSTIYLRASAAGTAGVLVY